VITAEFYLKDERLCGFSLRGHAGYGAAGEDIPCAAVSSAVELTANGVTEIVKAEAAVDVRENEIKLLLFEERQGKKEAAEQFLQALRLHLELLSGDYPGSLRILEAEV